MPSRPCGQPAARYSPNSPDESRNSPGRDAELARCTAELAEVERGTHRGETRNSPKRNAQLADVPAGLRG